jgi:hypothetical protein
MRPPGGGRPGVSVIAVLPAGAVLPAAAGITEGIGGQGHWMPGLAKWSSRGSPRAGFQSAELPGQGDPVSR